MKYVIVLAEVGSGKEPKLYQGSDLAGVIRKMRNANLTIRERVGWSWKMDRFIRENYSSVSRAELAALMSKEFNKTITKNAVIKRIEFLKSHGGKYVR